MSEQIKLFDDENGDTYKKRKRRWEYAFQQWCNAKFEECQTEYGKCGYGTMCDYCDNNVLGNGCIRALNQMLREKNIQIDYDKLEFENIWNGVFK